MTSTARRRPAHLVRTQQVFLALAFPVLMIALGVRLVATPVFLWLEYHRPGFPEDLWGMSTERRLQYGSYGLEYVTNLAPREYLGDLATTDGGPLFHPQEVAHMQDVQHVFTTGFLVAYVLLGLVLLSCWYLRRRAPGAASGGLFFGAWLTVVFLVLAGLAGVFAWQWLFSAFHSLFFTDGSWTFRISDTLIRLYPTRFWTDAGLTVALIAVAGAVLTILLTRKRMASGR